MDSRKLKTPDRPRIARTVVACLTVFLAGLALAPSCSAATKKKSSARSSSNDRIGPLSFSGTFSLHFVYDDNILRYNDATLLAFRRNENPAKFKVKTYDDLIISPRLGLTFGERLLGRRETTIRVGYVGWQYGQNRRKSNETWSVRLRQPTVGRDYVELNYSYSPMSYVRELSVRPPYAPRSMPIHWQGFMSARNGFALAYSKQLSGKLTTRIEGGRVLRYYNRPFMENDNWEWNLGAITTVRLPRRITATMEYTYSDVTARALDQVGETRETSDNSDASYERDLYQLEIGLRAPKGLWKVRGFSFTGQYQAYHFTGQKPPWLDQLHTGRKDNVYVFQFETDTNRIVGTMTLVGGYRYSQRTSSLPATVSAEDAEDKDYKDNRIWVGASYSF